MIVCLKWGFYVKKLIRFLSLSGWGIAGAMALSTVLTIVLLPHSFFNANGYLSLGFFHTVATVFQLRFAAVLKFTALFVCVAGLAGWLVSLFRSRIFSPVPGNIFRTGWYRIPVTVLLMVLAVFQFTAILPRKKPGPNVVVIVVDTLRNDHTAVSAGGRGFTPRLESQLMSEGISFPNSFSNSNWTLPSVASLITSRYPSDIGITGLTSVLDRREITLAEILKENGYRTGGVVSHMLVGKSYGLAQGFDWYNEDNITDDYGNHHSISSPGVTGKAIDYIRKNRDEKFFLFLHYFDPHYIYIDHEKALDYAGPFRSRDFRKLRNLVREGAYTPEDIHYLTACYRSEVSFTDSYVGKVLDELKHQGLFENTIVIFTADHGEEFLEHGWLGHSTHLYNQQIHVPLVIKPAKSESGSFPAVNSRVVSNLDIVPTLLNMLGIGDDISFQGRDIFSRSPEPPAVFSEVIQSQFREQIDQVCIITEGWKLIKDFNNNGYQLFNRTMDPSERNNRIYEKENVERHLKMKLAKWIKDNRQRKNGRNRKKLSSEEIRRLENLGYL